MDLRLRPLGVEDEQGARAAHAELAAGDFTFLLFWDRDQPWTTYLESLDNARRGVRLPTGLVPSTFLIADVGGDLVGRVSIRHELNDYLLSFGGHIGSAVRPQYRGRGYANEIFRQALVVARAEGVDRVLVTCDDDNLASIAVIERHGGVLEDVRAEPDDGARMRRYWIS